MNLASYTYWLAEQASGGIFYIGWASVLILTLAVVSGWFQRDGIKEKRKKALWLFLPLVGVFAILLGGALLKQIEAFWWVPYAGLFVTFLLSCVTVWKFPKGRFFASATSIFILWYGFWCAFVSIMSITDDWI
jgi:hypothetical protein